MIIVIYLSSVGDNEFALGMYDKLIEMNLGRYNIQVELK